MLTVARHPLLDVVVFTCSFPRTLGELGRVEAVASLLSGAAAAPLSAGDDVRGAVRDLLRHGGYKPTGRGKPASEYLVRAVGEGALASINACVDACNAVSLHSGLPVSVIDLDRARPPFRIDVAAQGSAYVFNAAGQTIDLAGLLCLFDARGPCANPVKDSQRTKTTADTRRTLTVVWGTRTLPGRTPRAFAWYEALLRSIGADVERLPSSEEAAEGDTCGQPVAAT